MANKHHLLHLLAVRPRTNAELQELCVDHSGAIARDMSKLIHDGDVVNLVGGKGRKALYALPGAE